jgi:hypothetical protein
MWKEKEHKALFLWIMNPPVTGPTSTMLLRLMAGGVFFCEGILKFASGVFKIRTRLTGHCNEETGESKSLGFNDGSPLVS